MQERFLWTALRISLQTDHVRSVIPFRLVWLFWLGALFWLSHQPRLPVPKIPIPILDKWMHLTYFLVGGVLYVLSWRGTRSRVLLAGVIFFAALGAVDEWHQSFVPGRSGLDAGDWIADCIGATLGIRLALSRIASEAAD